MANDTLTNVVTKEYLLTSLENFTKDILLNHFVEQEDGKFLISANDLDQITKNASEITYIKENLHEAGLSEEEVANILDKKVNAIINTYSAGLITQRCAEKELKQMSDTLKFFSNITEEDIAKASNEFETGEMDFAYDRNKEAEPHLPGSAA